MSLLARLSLTNRSLVALLSIAIVGFGYLATVSLRQELIPSLQLPMATVVTSYPGASPQIVEREITEPLEAAISGTDGLEDTTSTSSNGLSIVQAGFTYGTDIDSAVQEVRQAADRVGLPEDASVSVEAGSIDDFPVVALAVSSDLDEQELVDRLETDALPQLRGLEGVRDASLSGARPEQIVVDLDETALAENGLTADAVMAALRSAGVGVPGGDLTEGDSTLPVEVGTQFESLEDLRALPVGNPAAAAQSGGQPGGEQAGGQPGGGEAGAGQPGAGQAGQQPSEPVRLDDVATLAMEPSPTTSFTRTDGEPSLGLTVTKRPDGNTVTVSHDVQELIPELEKAIGGGATFTMVFDQAPFIEESIEGLTTEGLIGLGVAVLIIMVFLISARSTLVTALSIPFSLLVAMVGLFAGGYSLNILTLGALTVSIGRVVDDSIVVLENIKRHLSYGEEKVPAILSAVREVAGAITSSTVATVAVFLPIAFVGGQVGELFRPFAVTVTIALMASLLVSLTIIPVLAYWFLRRPAGVDTDPKRVLNRALERERRSPLQRIYVPIIRFTTKYRVITIIGGIAVFVGTMAMTPLLKTNFLDESGQNTLSITQTLPNGTSLERTDEAAAQVEDVLADTDGVETYQVTVGTEQFAGFTFGEGSNSATFAVTTDEQLEPDEQNALVDRLRDRLGRLDDAGDITVTAGASGPPGTGLEVIVAASDEDDLQVGAERVTEAMRDVDGATDVTSNLAADTPSVRVTVDREEAAAVGLTEVGVGQAIRRAFQGDSMSAIVGETTSDLVVRQGDVPSDLDELNDIEILTPLGQSISLSQIADVEEVDKPSSLSRIDGERSATITAATESGDLGAVTEDLRAALDEVTMPEGATWELGGASADQEESFAQMGLALLAAVVIVFAVMVATFGSIAQALILLVSVPFAATGSLGLLILTGTPLGLPGLIGMLMLVGIVVTNAIVLIDLINQYRRDGMPLRQAVIDGGRRRVRPILMTALATIGALTPMSLGLTGGGVLISQPLAIVVIGGLLSSTLLTLVLVPTLYSMVEGVKERVAARRASRRGVAPTAGGESAAADRTAGAEAAEGTEATGSANGTQSSGSVEVSTSTGDGDPARTTVANVGGDATVTVEVRVHRE